MKILIVADVYPPEVSSASHLIKELAEGLKKRGHEITVATSYPRHYLVNDGKKEEFGIFSKENGINVLRVKTLPLHKVNFIIRGISQLILPFLFFSKIKKFVKKGEIDAVIIYSPPLTMGLVGKMVKRRYGAKFILNIQDLFPQNAIDLGILKGWKHKPAIWIFEWIEKIVYKNADKITFHSDGGRRFLVEKKNVPESKIITLQNWVDLEPYRHLDKNLSFRKKYGLEGKFIFLFAGIMGPAQGLDFLVEIARKVSDLKDVVFLLVGDGTEKQTVEKLVDKYNLKNMAIKPFISKEEYPSLVKDADVGLVCLSSKNKTPFTPGKFLGYMAAGLPVLAFLNKESDAFGLVKRTGCGYAVESGDFEKAEEVVRKMAGGKEDLKRMGEKGLEYAKAELDADVCMEKIEKLVS
jgi:glycosyltransferase involved in cell wall biosynthesis